MALVKLTEEELIEKRAELGRVLKDIANAEAEVTTANERIRQLETKGLTKIKALSEMAALMDWL